MSHSPTAAEIRDDQYLDAWQQLAVRIQKGASFSGRERNCCFLNTGQPRFADASSVLGLDHDDDGRTLALSDWDHDGDVDIWMANRTGPRVRFLRNDVPNRNHFVALKLVGDSLQGTNRDAIGARVRLTVSIDGQQQLLSQTVTAGDSYLSQSSKWLTFGIGQATRIQQTSIRWPGSKTFVDVDLPNIDSRYIVQQSTGQAERTTKTRGVELAASAPERPTVSDTSRLRFSEPPLLQPIAYQDFHNNSVEHKVPLAGPMLLTLWSRTCQPCLQEFTEFGRQTELWKKHGLKLVALNVDGLAGQTKPPATELQTLLQSTGFPGETGFATDELIEKLDQLQRQSVYRQRALPVPTSFLLDHGGWVRVVYRGVVSIEQLTKDLENLRTTEAKGLALSLPFPGRWGRDIFVTNPIAVAAAQMEDGNLDEAHAYLQKFLDENPAPPADKQDQASALERRRLADIHHQLSRVARRQGQPRKAMGNLQSALKLNPNSLNCLIDLADAMLQRGELDKSDQALARAKKLHPRATTVHARIGELRMRQGRAAEAIPHLKIAVKSQRWLAAANNLAWILATHPDDSIRNGRQALPYARRVCDQYQYRQPAALDTLAAALASAGNFEEAVGRAEQAITLAGSQRLSDSIKGRLKLYRQGKVFVDKTLQTSTE